MSPHITLLNAILTSYLLAIWEIEHCLLYIIRLANTLTLRVTRIWVKFRKENSLRKLKKCPTPRIQKTTWVEGTF